MLLCDTGVLLAAGNVKDNHHAACLSMMRAAEGPLLIPSPVLGEIGYLLQSRVGPHAEVTFLKSFGGNGFHVAEVEESDISRIAELVEQYVSLPLGIVEAPPRAAPVRYTSVGTELGPRTGGKPTDQRIGTAVKSDGVIRGIAVL